MKNAKMLGVFLAIPFMAGCGERPHVHTFEQTWSISPDMHWHAASCEHKELSSGLSLHTFNENDECSVCGYVKDTPTSRKLSIALTNAFADSLADFEQTYFYGEYASVKLVAIDDYALPDEIKVTSGNEYILDTEYTYVLNEDKTSADFIIKMNKDYEVSVKAFHKLGSIFIGEHEITKSGDYSELVDDSGYSANRLVYTKETNTLTIRNAVFSDAKIGMAKITDDKTEVVFDYLFAYTGSETLNIELYGDVAFHISNAKSKYISGGIISVNGAQMNIQGPANLTFSGADHSLISTMGNLNIDDVHLTATGCGDYGIFAKNTAIDSSTIEIDCPSDAHASDSNSGGLWAMDLSIKDSSLNATDFGVGIHATNLRIFDGTININAAKIGIDCDWIKGFGKEPVGFVYSTFISVVAKEGGISSYDVQSWENCEIHVITEKGHGIYTIDTAIYFDRCSVAAETGAEGDGIHAYRMSIKNSIIHGQSQAEYNAGISSSIYSGQSPDKDKQRYISIQNSMVSASANWGALYGLGTLIVNGEKGYEDDSCHYLEKQFVGNTYIYGLFPLDVTEMVTKSVPTAGGRTEVPENCSKTIEIYAVVDPWF